MHSVTQFIEDVTFTARGLSVGLVAGLVLDALVGHAGVTLAAGAAIGAGVGLLLARRPIELPRFGSALLKR